MTQPLKILHLIEPGGGGTMRHVVDLSAAQIAAGHSVTIAYSPIRLEKAYKNQLLFLKEHSGVTLLELPMRRAPHVSDIKNLWLLQNVLRKEKPDILHAHSTKAGMMARLAGSFTNAKIIYTPHAMMSLNPAMPPWQRTAYKIYEQFTAGWVDRMIMLSRHEMAHVMEMGIPPHKIMMAQNGIGPLPRGSREELRAAANIPAGAPVVGFVGRMTAQKNSQLALRAFAAAKRHMSDLFFYAVGEGELLAECRALAQQLGIQDSVRWMGGVDAREHYAAMDALLITSRYEGMAYVLLEALQSGVPIVTTDVGGSESTVIPYQTGVIAEANAEELGKWVAEILSDVTMLDAMRFACRARAQHFGIAAMAESVMAVYDDALSAR